MPRNIASSERIANGSRVSKLAFTRSALGRKAPMEPLPHHVVGDASGEARDRQGTSAMRHTSSGIEERHRMRILRVRLTRTSRPGADPRSQAMARAMLRAVSQSTRSPLRRWAARRTRTA